MTTVSELLRSRATQIGEIRRTGRQDLASNLLRDLFLIAEGIEVNKPAHLIAEMLSDSLSVTAPAPAPDVSVYPFLATFRGQGEQLGHIVDLDDIHTFYVTAAEASDAVPGGDIAEAIEFDDLKTAALAPAEVRDWSGPFEIKVERRRYRIEQAGQQTIYADDDEALRAAVIQRLEIDATSLSESVPAPALRQAEALDNRVMIINGGTILIAGSAGDLRIVQQELDVSEPADAIV